MKKINPYLRYIVRTSYLLNKKFIKAYDCRFFYILSGSGKFFTKEKEYQLLPDTVMYYPSGIEYHIKSDEKNPMKFITVNFDFTDKYPSKEVLRPVYTEDFDISRLQPSHKEIDEPLFLSIVFINNANNLLPYFVKMTETFKNSGDYSGELCSSLLKSLILEILYAKNKTTFNNTLIAEIIKYINNNYKESLTNHSIASAFNYHPYYIGTLFHTHTGKTLREYIEEVRFTHAEELLTLTNDNIFNIAIDCGFQTAEHFTKRFKVRYDTTPTKWRKNHYLI